MKTDIIYLHELRNQEHYQFNTDFCGLVAAATAAALKIEAEYGVYLSRFAGEGEAIRKIMKSAVTLDIQQAHRRRGKLFRGLAMGNRAATGHYLPEVREAARQMKIVFDAYGYLSQKPINEATAAIYKFTQELRENHAGNLSILRFGKWVDALANANGEVETLVQTRYEESAHRTALVLKEVRTGVDTAYRAIITRIDALAIVEGGDVYDDFICRHNTVVEYYNLLLATRHGRHRAASPKEQEVER